jgi:hypothetical protein
MLIRIPLIASLVLQLALSYRCCGVAILRPDVVAACERACRAVGSCAPDSCATSGCPPLSCSPVKDPCCGVMSCSDATDADSQNPTERPVDQPQGPCSGPVVFCSPLEQKKAGPEIEVITIMPMIAHPAVAAPPAIAAIDGPQFDGIPPPFKTNRHARQAWLSVWLI